MSEEFEFWKTLQGFFELRESGIVDQSVGIPDIRRKVEGERQTGDFSTAEQILDLRIEDWQIRADFPDALAAFVAIILKYLVQRRIPGIRHGAGIDVAERNEPSAVFLREFKDLLVGLRNIGAFRVA